MNASILWFRRDLRVKDNRLLSKDNVLPIFIFDTDILKKLARDDARVSFIFQLVVKLKADLKSLGLNLAVFCGKPKDIFLYLKECGFGKLSASVDYDSYALRRDDEISKIMSFEKVNDTYLFDFKSILNTQNKPYNVFTAFYKKALDSIDDFTLASVMPSAQKLVKFDYENLICISNGEVIKKQITLENLSFTPNNLISCEPCAFDAKDYERNRDILYLDATSKIGAYLRFGAVSIRDVYNKFADISPIFAKQLIWREFFAYILYYYPHSETNNFLNININWENDEAKFNAWKGAKTGVPIVDAAMSELNTTGFMHNRARMIAASFLTKDLHIDWRFGEEYFAGKLLDYDASSNIGSWQWCASTGVDAQPYFRIFNPYLQTKRFDTNALYIKKFLPQLKNIDARVLQDERVLFNTNIKDYPKPIINHKIAAQASVYEFKRARRLSNLDDNEN